jgi:hypothetical protein
LGSKGNGPSYGHHRLNGVPATAAVPCFHVLHARMLIWETMHPHHRLCWAILPGHHESRVRHKEGRLLQRRCIGRDATARGTRPSQREAESLLEHELRIHLLSSDACVRTHSLPLFGLKFSIHTPIEWRDEMERVGGTQAASDDVCVLDRLPVSIETDTSTIRHAMSQRISPGIPAVSSLPTSSDGRRRGHIMVCSSFRLAGLTD